MAISVVASGSLMACAVVSSSLVGTQPDKDALLVSTMPQESVGLYSSHRCIGGSNRIEEYDRRVCRFDNVCYADGHFLYYQKVKTPLVFDRKRGIQYKFLAEGGHPFASYLAYNHAAGPFAPNIIRDSIPEIAIRQKGSFSLWKAWAQPANFAHLVWEDIGTIYYTQRRLEDAFNGHTQTLHVGPFPSDADFRRILDGILPALSTRPALSLEAAIGASNGDNGNSSSLVCFEYLFVGAPTPLFQYKYEPLGEGREELLRGYRTSILTHYDIKEGLPESPVIYITHKSFSTWAHKKAGGRHRAIANAYDLEKF